MPIVTKRSVSLVAICLVIVLGTAGAARRPAASKRSHTARKSAPARPVASPDPDPLYVRSSPYNRLFVEVDTVQGTVVDPRWLAELKAFLVQFADKPAGVHLVQGRSIPLSQAKGLSPNEIAGLNIQGPPAGARSTAFIYVLFYDSHKLGARKPDNPHVSYADYPCAIYFDTAYGRGAQRAFAVNALRHEAGHVLGLCKNRAHGDGAHCRNPKCLMYPTLTLSPKWYLHPAPRKDLCPACRRDLAATRAAGPDPRFRFEGPVLVRHEKGYWVMSTPGLVSLVFDSRQAADWRGMLANYRQWVRQRPSDRPQGICTAWQFQARTPKGIVRLKTALADARRDASPLVQTAARDAETQLHKELTRIMPARSSPKTLAAANKRPAFTGRAAVTVDGNE